MAAGSFCLFRRFHSGVVRSNRTISDCIPVLVYSGSDGSDTPRAGNPFSLGEKIGASLHRRTVLLLVSHVVLAFHLAERGGHLLLQPGGLFFSVREECDLSGQARPLDQSDVSRAPHSSFGLSGPTVLSSQYRDRFWFAQFMVAYVARG